jgi:hypothetical protein
MCDDAREALAEDALGAEAVATAEAAGAQFEPDGDAVPGQVGDGADVVAMDARRGAIAARALGLLSCGSDD